MTIALDTAVEQPGIGGHMNALYEFDISFSGTVG